MDGSGGQFFNQMRNLKVTESGASGHNVPSDTMPLKVQNFLHNKGNYKQGKKTAIRMGENNRK